MTSRIEALRRLLTGELRRAVARSPRQGSIDVEAIHETLVRSLAGFLTEKERADVGDLDEYVSETLRAFFNHKRDA